MTGAAPRCQRHLALDRRVGAHDAMVVIVGVAKHLGMCLQQAIQHVRDKLLRVIEDLLQRIDSLPPGTSAGEAGSLPRVKRIPGM